MPTGSEKISGEDGSSGMAFETLAKLVTGQTVVVARARDGNIHVSG